MNQNASLSFNETASKKPIDVLSEHGKSFHFAGKFLGKEQMNDCARLYSFCRYVDDIADESQDIKTAIEHLNRIAQDIKSGYSQDPRVTDFIALVAEKQIDHEVIDQLLTGLIQDLDGVFFVTERQLKRYCYRVAGTVGLMMCAVLDVKDPRAMAFAIDLGIAMQLTNIARDVYEDALNDRSYIPAEWTSFTAIDQIINPTQSQKLTLKSSIAKLLIEAERYYESAGFGLVFLPLRARLAITIAAQVYREIGNEIAQMDFAVWQQRAFVSESRKVGVAFNAMGEFMWHNKYHNITQNHDPQLHLQLGNLPGCHHLTLKLCR